MKRGWKKIAGWTLMLSIFSINLVGLNAASASEPVYYPEFSSGYSFSLAVKKDGTVWGWGSNTYNQLGNTTPTENRTHTPVQIPGLTDVATVAGGYTFSMAIKKDGTLWAWGSNSHGQLGDGTTTPRKTPVQVKDPADPTGYLTGVKQVALGWTHGIALKADGTIWTWGNNASGQLGYAASSQLSAKQVAIDPNIRFKQVAASDAHRSYALTTTGEIWAWGANGSGELGNGLVEHVRVNPSRVLSPEMNYTTHWTGVDSIAVGSYHVLAMKNGAVWAWGDNYLGQLGNNSNTDYARPVRVLADSSALTSLSGVKAIYAGGHTSIAMMQDGTLKGWGGNNSIQLSDGTSINRKTPVVMKQKNGQPLANIVKLTVTSSFVVTLRTDGTLWAWGASGNGELGNGSYVGTYDHVKVKLYATNADLAGLQLSAGTLQPAFSATVTDYAVRVDDAVTGITVVPTAADARATLSVSANGSPFEQAASEQSSHPIALNVGVNELQIVVRAEDPSVFKVYKVKVTRELPINHAPTAAGQLIEIEEGTQYNGALSGADSDQDSLRYTLVDWPTMGLVDIDPETGEFLYLPYLSASGTDTFTFKVNDGEADSSIATVTIVIKDLPNEDYSEPVIDLG